MESFTLLLSVCLLSPVCQRYEGVALNQLKEIEDSAVVDLFIKALSKLCSKKKDKEEPLQEKETEGEERRGGQNKKCEPSIALTLSSLLLALLHLIHRSNKSSPLGNGYCTIS